jgi:hypothetical protein
LPHELDAAARRQAAQDFVRPIVERHGVAAQVSLHAPDREGDQRNWHAHILFSHRELGPDGFGDIANRRTITKKVKGQEKQIEIAGIAATPADIKALRKEWEQVVNRAYERAGLDIRVDHRSHEDRGLDQEPTIHIGPAAAEIEKREPGASDRAKTNRDIAARNAARHNVPALDAEVKQLSAEIIDLRAERAMREAYARTPGRYDRLNKTHDQVAREQHPGKYDELKAATPPPEVVRQFEANASRTAEPAAPIYDRDADNAAWEDRIAAAGIAAHAERTMQEASAFAKATADGRDAANGRTDGTRAAQEARQQPGDTAGRETRAGEPEPSTSPEGAANVAAEPAPATGMRSADRVAGRIFGGIVHAAVESLVGFLDGFLFGGGEPKLTPLQQNLAASADAEQAQANAAAAADAAKDAAQIEIIFRQDRQQQQDDFAARYGVPGGGSDRDRDYDRGRERER